MSGTVILIIILLIFLFALSMGFYCYFCFGESGGRSFEVMSPAAPVSVPAITVIPRRKCRCSDKFKGLCAHCDGPDFDDGGMMHELTDFSDFGGDKGFGDGKQGNPIERLISNSSTDQNAGGTETAVGNVSVTYASDYY